MGEKCIDSLGRIVIPKEIRNQLGLKHGEQVCFRVDEERKILMIEKNKTKYFCCSSNNNLIKMKNGYYICKECIQDLKLEK